MATPSLRVSLVQSDLHWENPKANKAHFSKILAPLANTTDLIVLPEMFTTGFSMNAEHLSEAQNGPTVQWLVETSKLLSSAIVGLSLIHI